MTIGIYILYWGSTDLLYIGQSQNIHKRLAHHRWAMSNNRHVNYKVQEHYNKYGLPEEHIIEECTLDLLDIKESEWIKEFDSINNGLNIEDPISCNFGSYKYSNMFILIAFRLLCFNRLSIPKISKKLGINISTIRSIASGQNYCWLKTRYPFHYHKMMLVNRKVGASSIISRGITYRVRNAEGKEYTVENILAFCTKYNLNLGNFSSMLYGKFLQCKGWHLSTTTLPTKKLLKLRSPQGDIVTITDRTSFCKKYNLDTSSLSRLISGKYLSTKGWTLVND